MIKLPKLPKLPKLAARKDKSSTNVWEKQKCAFFERTTFFHQRRQYRAIVPLMVYNVQYYTYNALHMCVREAVRWNLQYKLFCLCLKTHSVLQRRIAYMLDDLRDETGQYIKLSVIANTAQLLQISLQFADLLTYTNININTNTNTNSLNQIWMQDN